jgi:glycosyltransferase involved in cell wall biosynthesis
LVSVVIPVFNGEAYLGEAIDSALAQTHTAVEVIVVDDGSNDGSAAVAAAYGPAVRLLPQANGGPAAAMNTGVSQAGGTYLSFLSADDRWVPDKLRWQLAHQHDHPETDLVFGHVQHFMSPEVDPETARRLRCPADPMPASSAGTLLVARSTFDRVGLFDEQFRSGEFFDWFTRAADAGLTAYVLPQVVSLRRVHGGNHSLQSSAPTASYARVLKAAIDRRRAAKAAADEQEQA